MKLQNTLALFLFLPLSIKWNWAWEANLKDVKCKHWSSSDVGDDFGESMCSEYFCRMSKRDGSLIKQRSWSSAITLLRNHPLTVIGSGKSLSSWLQFCFLIISHNFSGEKSKEQIVGDPACKKGPHLLWEWSRFRLQMAASIKRRAPPPIPSISRAKNLRLSLWLDCLDVGRGGWEGNERQIVGR